MVNLSHDDPTQLGIVSTETFTRLRQIVEGASKPDSFARLHEYLANSNGEIRYRIEGSTSLGHNGGGREPRLQCIITGWLELQCQATLQPLRHNLALAKRFILVEREDGLPPLEEEADDEDYIVAGREFDLAALVEDEVILDLPMVPRAAMADAEALDEKGDTAEQRQSAFAVLAGLKKPNL